MSTVRFWIFSPAGGAVRLKMRPGDSLRHYWATDTDEGWSSMAQRWRFDGARVEHDDFSDGRDCDGRLQEFSEAFFWANEAEAGYLSTDHDHAGGFIRYPNWQPLTHGQRDFTAEAAGY